MKKGIITKIITAAIATTLVIGGATVMAAPAGNVETDITYDVVIGKTNETLSREYTFIPERDGIYHFESSNIRMDGGYGIIDPMVRIFVGDQVTPDNQIASIDGGVSGTLDFSGDVELTGGQVYTLKISSHFNPNLRPTGRFDFQITDVTPMGEPTIEPIPDEPGEPVLPVEPDEPVIPSEPGNGGEEPTEDPTEDPTKDPTEDPTGDETPTDENEIIITVIFVEEETVSKTPCC